VRTPQTKQTAVMGCYGIGVSRLISALAEVHHDAYGVRWPTVVAPYRVAIIVLHGGLRKKAQDLADTMAAHGEALYDELDAGALRGDVVLDTSDRSAGVKLAEAALIGYPYCVVVGKRHDSDRLEVKRRAADTKAGHADSEYMSASALVSAIMQECTRTP
jgi:prolyl-tRNA synthetase